MTDRDAPGPGRDGARRKLLPHARPGPREAADLEIRHHLEAKVERLVAQGWDPDRARLEAERAFGDVVRVREEVRDVDRRHAPWAALAALGEGIAWDLRHAVRAASRTPLFALAVVATLGVGIGANAAIFSVVEAVLLRPLPYPEPDRIVYVFETTPQDDNPFAVAPANFLDWTERQRSFEAMAAVAGGTALVTEGGDPERIAGVRVSVDYFRVLGVQPAMGRTFTAAEDRPDPPNVAVVSHAFWAGRLGADPRVIGRSVRLDGEPHTVIGVMPREMRAYQNSWSPSPIAVWRPYAFASNPPSERIAKRLVVLARLRDGVTAQGADTEMKALAAGLASEHPDSNEGWGAGVQPLPEAMTEGARTPLLVLLGAVGFILLIACLNVGNLLLARADARRTAITLRRALGAGRSRIVRQLLAESLVLSLAGAVLGVLLAWALLPALVAASPIDVTRMGDVGVNGSVLAFALAVAVLAAVLTGLAPAVGTWAADLVEELKERGLGKTESRRRRAAKSALVVAEIGLSVVLVIGSGLMLGSYARLSGLDLGFEPEGLVSVTVQLPRTRYADAVGRGSTPATENFTLWRLRPEEPEFMDRVQAAMSRVPGVEAVAAGNFPPLPGMVWGSPVRPAGEPAPEDPRDVRWAVLRAVSANWFGTLGISVVRGRSFHEEEKAGGEDVVVLDEEAARALWPGQGQDPLGRFVMLRDGQEDPERPFRVVGVVRGVRQAIFWSGGEVVEDPVWSAYVPYRQQAEAYVDWQIGFRTRGAFVVRTDRDLAEVAPEFRRVVWSVDPDLPVGVERLTDAVGQTLADRRFYMGTLVAFGLLAVLLAASGVFAVMAYSVTRKTRELGIRMALGARAADLQRAELARGIRLAAAGVVIGAAGAAALARFIAGFLYGVSTVDPAVYGAAALVLAASTLVAAYLPARRASGVDPVESLRTE